MDPKHNEAAQVSAAFLNRVSSIYNKVWHFGGRWGAGSRYGVTGYGGFGRKFGANRWKSWDFRENLFYGWKGVRYNRVALFQKMTAVPVSVLRGNEKLCASRFGLLASLSVTSPHEPDTAQYPSYPPWPTPSACSRSSSMPTCRRPPSPHACRLNSFAWEWVGRCPWTIRRRRERSAGAQAALTRPMD